MRVIRPEVKNSFKQSQLKNNNEKVTEVDLRCVIVVHQKCSNMTVKSIFKRQVQDIRMRKVLAVYK